jgi:poly(3-hydroxyalkanoate) synthetase
VRGSWWDDYVAWLDTRTGPLRNKPRRLGSAAFEPLCDAPGTYVLDR